MGPAGLADARRPALEHGVVVVLAAQSQIAPVRGLIDVSGRQVVGIRNDERSVLAAQKIQNVIVEPGGMAKLKSRGYCRRQLLEKNFQSR